MPAKYKRDILVNVNKYQDRMLYPFYASCLFSLVCLVIIGYLLSQYPLFRFSGTYRTLMSGYVDPLKVGIICIGFGVLLVFILLIYWAYSISNKILGPYERILKDLDKMIIGKKKGPFKARDDDEAFNELIQRLNVLLVKKKQKRNYPDSMMN